MTGSVKVPTGWVVANEIVGSWRNMLTSRVIWAVGVHESLGGKTMDGLAEHIKACDAADIVVDILAGQHIKVLQDEQVCRMLGGFEGEFGVWLQGCWLEAYVVGQLLGLVELPESLEPLNLTRYDRLRQLEGFLLECAGFHVSGIIDFYGTST